MAGGDLRVTVTPGLMMGGAGMAKTIDANSVKSGNMTEARNVNGKNVFMTETGAKMFDELKGMEFMKVRGPEEDPGAIKKFFLGDGLPEDASTIGKP